MHSAQGDLCLRVTAGNDCSVHGAEVQDLYEVGELFSLKTDKKSVVLHIHWISLIKASYSHFKLLTYESVNKILASKSNKSSTMYFLEVLLLYKVVLSFKSVDNIL